MHIYKSLSFVALLLSLFLLSENIFTHGKVFAEEITASGNGIQSVSTVSDTTTSATSVTSNNTITADTNITTIGNTGNNSADGNTGNETSIQTGNVTTDISVDTKANANENSNPDCCSQKGTLTVISGNGSGSQNTVTTSNTNNTTITANQNATITNVITGSANTGNNTASGNIGTVSVKTGSINSSQLLTNGPLNIQTIGNTSSRTRESSFIIDTNGSKSTNFLLNKDSTSKYIEVNNVANVFNNTLLTLTTGDNEVDDNTGEVYLDTGDIVVTTNIITGPINVSNVTTSCGCKKEEEKPQPVTPAPPVEKVTPQTPTTTDKPSGPHGEVASITASKELPETGVDWLMLAILGNVMMLFLGTILRLRSGNSPGPAL